MLLSQAVVPATEVGPAGPSLGSAWQPSVGPTGGPAPTCELQQASSSKDTMALVWGSRTPWLIRPQASVCPLPPGKQVRRPGGASFAPLLLHGWLLSLGPCSWAAGSIPVVPAHQACLPYCRAAPCRLRLPVPDHVLPGQAECSQLRPPGTGCWPGESTWSAAHAPPWCAYMGLVRQEPCVIEAKGPGLSHGQGALTLGLRSAPCPPVCWGCGQGRSL